MRDNANVAEQIKAIQDHRRIVSQASEHNPPPRIAATRHGQQLPWCASRYRYSRRHKPQPSRGKAKLSSTSRPPAPPPAPAR
jgi:hypothetical protein